MVVVISNSSSSEYSLEIGVQCDIRMWRKRRSGRMGRRRLDGINTRRRRRRMRDGDSPLLHFTVRLTRVIHSPADVAHPIGIDDGIRG